MEINFIQLREYFRLNRLVVAAASTAGLTCLLVYLRTLGFDFIYIDDPAYVYNNPQIRTLDPGLIVSAFTRLFAGDYWMPLTWISFAVDYHFWELNPAGYHLTNIVLHALNTGLVVLVADNVLKGVRGSTSEVQSSGDTEPGTQNTEPGWLYPAMLLFSGLLWGLHPLRVESVAWVTERKDVLNGLFSLGTMLLYLLYLRKASRFGGRRAAGLYLACLALFVLSLMAKPSSVVLPALLLVADWYPLGRMNRGSIVRLLLEKLPFVLLSIAVTAITILAKMQYGGLYSSEAMPLSVRTVLSGNAVFEYVRLSLWPVGIIPFYPIPRPIPAAFVIKAACVAVCTIGAICLANKRSWVSATWLCFVLALLPVLAFLHNGFDVAFAPRFTYIPSVVPSIAISAVICRMARGISGPPTLVLRRGSGVLAIMLVLWYAGMTFRLAGAWRDTETLWTRQIQVLPLGRAYNARGHFYLIRDRYPEAIRDFSTALEIAVRGGSPYVDNILAFRGDALRLAGQYGEAVRDFSEAIGLNPRPRYFYHRGLVLKSLGRVVEAEEDFRRAGSDTGRIVWFAEGEE